MLMKVATKGEGRTGGGDGMRGKPGEGKGKVEGIWKGRVEGRAREGEGNRLQAP